MISKIQLFLFGVVKTSIQIYWTLLKIVIPVMIIVRIGIGFGLHIKLANLMAPFMSVLDLPPETSLVIVTTLVAGMYGGATVLAAMISDINMTVAQATVLTSIMVVAHALPIEQKIVHSAGVRLIFATLIRMITAFLLGWILHLIYDLLDVLQTPLSVSWAPDTQIDAPWFMWIQNTAVSFFYIFGVILFLILVLRLFDITGATRLITRGLSPFLSIMGISKDATNITMTGVLLGVMFGGGLILQEAKSGKLGHRTIFQSLVLMSICHGLIEDTLFALILGGHISGVFFGRIVIVVIVMVLVNKLIRTIPETTFYRYCYRLP
jgi:hypothetical protein